jgi:TolB-like protein/DNA-binding winged helix-turn-helix (wHTH) protein
VSLGETVTKPNDNSMVVGDVVVAPAMNMISRADRVINLRPQVMELLVFLASHAGEVVSVEELLDTLWSGKIVTDGTLYNCVGELRQAIASLDDTRPYIENIPKKGYRLSAPVGQLDDSMNTPDARGRFGLRTATGTRPGLRPVSILALLVGLLVAVATVVYLHQPPEYRSIAVLPFEDMSPGRDHGYFANGIADELRLELQRLDGLRVAGTTSSIAYAKEDSKTIGEILDVDAIVEGSVRKEGESVRIAVQLTHAADGFTAWSDAYDYKLENIFEMQEEIATSVAGALGVRLGVGTVNSFRGAGTRNVEAYELYMRANSLDWSRTETENTIRLLERAVELDPNYAAAWSLLGLRKLSKVWNAFPHQYSQVVDRAIPFIHRGVEIDPELATAQMALAMLRHAQYDWIGAEQSHLRALELVQDRLTIGNYARVLMRAGRMAYAQQQFDLAQSVEPLGGRHPNMAWHVHVAQGRFDEAREMAGTQGPPDYFEDLVDIAIGEGDPEKLKAAMQAMPEHYVAFGGLYAAVLAEFDSPEGVLLILREVYEDESLQWIRKLHDIAMLAAFFGDPQFALDVKSEELRLTGSRMNSLWYPITAEVRRLPEFKQLMMDVNLVEYWRAYGWSDYCRPLGDEDFECF